MTDQNSIQNTADGGNSIPANGEAGKTFTQDDVNRIVSKRLAEEKAKLESNLVEKEKALNARELTIEARGKLNEHGLPMELIEALNISTPEALDKSLDILVAAMGTKNKTINPPPPGRTVEIPEDLDIRRGMGLTR
jgi:hypothetical protein